MIRIYLIVAAISGAAIIGGLIMFANDQRSIGGATVREQQEKANAQFRVRSAKGRVNYDLCDTAGGVFDFAKGTCQLP